MEDTALTVGYRWFPLKILRRLSNRKSTGMAEDREWINAPPEPSKPR